MSKNITIQENGVAQNLSLDALRLPKKDGGTEDWVPADGKNLVELQIGGSGTYKASDYNAYGIAVARVKPKYGGGATSKAAEHNFTEKHTPAIKEGGKSRNFSAAMLKTNLQGGGTCLWIPRMDVELKNKYISKSGTYAAKADDCYGFDQVTVSGVDVEITQDDDGDDVARITDGGDATDEKLPSSIRVTVLPRKIDYTTGETIDYTGLVVHAYTNSGIDLGTVPFGELILPVQKAGDGWAEEWTDGNGLNAMMVACTPHYGVDWRGEEYTVYVGQVLGTDNQGNPASYGSGYSEPSTRLITRYNGYNFGLLITGPGNTDMYSNRPQLPGDLSHGWAKVGATSAQLNTERFSNADWAENLTNVPTSTKDPTAVDPSTLYANGESIPVQWHRPRDGELLETSFNIYTRSA